MKIRVLAENMTRIDAYYLGEPGVSYHIECEGKNFLFDTGYSDAYLRNAEKMGIDLSKLDGIILSHGHNDHTGGLRYLPKNINAPIYAHTDIFAAIEYEGLSVGSPITEQELKENHILHLSKDPVFLTDHLVFLGSIPRNNDFESKEAIGKRLKGGVWEPDFLPDDSALAYMGKEGLTIITGCSHAGICNITEYAKTVCNETRIAGIIGGFHLMKMSDRVLKTIEYIKEQKPKLLCPSHCTCFEARSAMNNEIHVTELCVGDTFEIE